MKVITQDNFKEELASGITLVDLYADWCGPCRALTPILEEMDGKIEGVKFVKLDTDASPSITSEYNIMSIPTILIFKDGAEVKRIVGLNPKEIYAQALEEVKK